MDLLNDVLSKALSSHEMKVVFENLEVGSTVELVEAVCYKAIVQIRNALNDESLDDFNCIERIVQILEGIGAGGGMRHDFG